MDYDLGTLRRLAKRRDKIDNDRALVTAAIEEEMRRAKAAGVDQGDIAAAGRVTRETVRVACLPEAEREAWKTRRRRTPDPA
jgi:hypothetical protein